MHKLKLNFFWKWRLNWFEKCHLSSKCSMLNHSSTPENCISLPVIHHQKNNFFWNFVISEWDYVDKLLKRSIKIKGKMKFFRLFQVILEVRNCLTDLLNGNIRFSYSHELIISAEVNFIFITTTIKTQKLNKKNWRNIGKNIHSVLNFQLPFYFVVP